MKSISLEEELEVLAIEFEFYELALLLGNNPGPWSYQKLTFVQLLAARNTELGKQNSKVEATILISILVHPDMSLKDCLDALNPPDLKPDETLYRTLSLKALSLARKAPPEELTFELGKDRLLPRPKKGKHIVALLEDVQRRFDGLSN